MHFTFQNKTIKMDREWIVGLCVTLRTCFFALPCATLYLVLIAFYVRKKEFAILFNDKKKIHFLKIISDFVVPVFYFPSTHTNLKCSYLALGQVPISFLDIFLWNFVYFNVDISRKKIFTKQKEYIQMNVQGLRRKGCSLWSPVWYPVNKLMIALSLPRTSLPVCSRVIR